MRKVFLLLCFMTVFSARAAENCRLVSDYSDVRSSGEAFEAGGGAYICDKDHGSDECPYNATIFTGDKLVYCKDQDGYTDTWVNGTSQIPTCLEKDINKYNSGVLRKVGNFLVGRKYEAENGVYVCRTSACNLKILMPNTYMDDYTICKYDGSFGCLYVGKNYQEGESVDISVELCKETYKGWENYEKLTKCHNKCVNGTMTTFRLACADGYTPGADNNSRNIACQKNNDNDNGSSEIECPSGYSKDITSQDNCKEGQTFECTVSAADGSCICGRCTGGSGGGGSGGSGSGGGSAPVGKCHPSVCYEEVCIECCKRPSSETIWDRTARVCQCVNGGKFQKENNIWSCKVDAGQVTTPDAGYICDATLTAKFAGWKVQCATRTDIMQSIAELEAYCAGKPTKEIFLRLYDEVSVMARMCQQQQQDQQQQLEEQRRQEERAKAEALRKSRRNISDAHGILVGMRETFKASVWKDEEGKFNTSRLVSDSIAGVVLGTVGGVVTSNVVKKNQVENGFEDIKCTVGGQTVADWGDEFRVGIQ